jgi:hypothetical protein
MKRILLVMVFLIGGLFNVTVGAIHESPVIEVSISSAQACDEFHGDNNCTCQQSVFNPCCPWWQPWKCPSPVPQNKKDVAQAKADWFDSASYSLAVITGALAFGLPESIIAMGVAGSTAAIAKQLAEDQRKIIRNIQDADYWQAYDPPWQSAESLGLSYTENYWVNQMVGDTQGVAQMADMISVESAKALACDMNGADCGGWHRDRVNWALWYLGWYINDLGDNAWNAATYFDGDLAYQLQAMAWEANDAGWRYQQ